MTEPGMTPPGGRAPLINAPLPLTVFAVLLIALHGVREFAPQGFQNEILYHGALIPERFWGWLTGAFPGPIGVPAYGNALEAAAPLALSALIHGDWFHVVLNAAFWVAVGKPVLEMISGLRGRGGAGAAAVLFILFFLSQAAGGAVYYLVHNPYGPVAVGASGGVSGVLGALFLMRDGARARILSRNFISVAVIFTIANALLAFMGPAMLGAGIAWEVHLGGFAAGALIGRFLIWDALRRAGP
ncbi:rhomboid family intramembrane serine protease [Hyphomonas sp.]|uniref:rhomboid family intramembrane serine protease n=1 Tax=Hyphomonas sp. TaxID=87 RepID=UPI003918C053